MTRQTTGSRIRDALDAMGLLGTLPDARGLPFAERQARLEAWKSDLLAPRFKQLVRELHPDRGGDTAAMARVNAARDLLVDLRPRPDPEPVVVVQIVFYGASTSTSWTRVTR